MTKIKVDVDKMLKEISPGKFVFNADFEPTSSPVREINSKEKARVLDINKALKSYSRKMTSLMKIMDKPLITSGPEDPEELNKAKALRDEKEIARLDFERISQLQSTLTKERTDIFYGRITLDSDAYNFLQNNPELQRLKQQVAIIDEWIDNYEGEDEALIDRKLDEQKKYLDRISMIRNAYINSQ